nr:HAD-IIIA family hydrolase [Laspinema sp. D3d]
MIIFDKDWSLVGSASGEGAIQSPTDQQILPGAAEAISNFYERGFKIAIASNQGGVELGKKSLSSAIEEMKFCLRLFPQIDFGLLSHTYTGKSAWRVSQEHCDEVWGNFGCYRKPGPGMLNFLMQFYGCSPSQTWFIGDRPEDEQAAEAAGTQFMAADIVRARYLPGFSELQVNVEQLEFLEPSLKGVYRWE